MASPLWGRPPLPPVPEPPPPPDDNAPPLPTEEQARLVINYALSFLGAPYVYGATNYPPGFDCSGFMQRVWGDLGVSLPRVSRTQGERGLRIRRIEDLQPGDLILFVAAPRSRRVTHVALYMGDNQMVHAATQQRMVVVESLHRHWVRRFSHGQRLLGQPGFVIKPRAAPVAVAEAGPEEETDDGPEAHAGSLPPSSEQPPPVVSIGGKEVYDPDLAEQLKGVDTDDPDQFEHAGEPLPAFMARFTDPLAAVLADHGPRHLRHQGNSFGLHLGMARLRERRGDPARTKSGWYLYLSPEATLEFPRINLSVDMGYPLPFYYQDGGGEDHGQVGLTDPGPGGGDWRDYTRILRAIAYGAPDDWLYLALDRYACVTLGYGQLLDMFSPVIGSPYLPGAEFGYTPLSWQGRLRLHGLTVETFLSDVAKRPAPAAVRLQLQPLVAAGVAQDMPVLGMLGLGLSWAGDFAAQGMRHHLALDFATTAWRTKRHDTELYIATVFPVWRDNGEETPPAMATAAMGAWWRFGIDPRRRHHLRLRMEMFWGKGWDTLFDTFHHQPAAAARDRDALGVKLDVGYRFLERFEAGISYAPDFWRRGDDNGHSADKLQLHLLLRQQTLGRRVQLSGQVIYQAMISNDSAQRSTHYLLSEATLRFFRYGVAGVIVRKPLGGSFTAQDIEWSLWTGVEAPF